MTFRRPLRARRAVVAAGVLLLAAIGVASAGADSGSRQVLAGSKPSWTAAVAQTGTVSAQQIAARVWLTQNNRAQLEALAKAVSDPTSAQYGQYLTTAQYDATYAPTAAQVAAVSQWLTGAGLQIVQVGPDNHYLAVNGSAAAIKAAFGTTLGLFQVNGKAEQAPTQDLSVPSNVAGLVTTVTGLTKFGHKVTQADFGPPNAFVNATPCSSYYGEKQASDLPKFMGSTLPYAICGYTPSQLRSVYGERGLGLSFGGFGGFGLGAGQNVAITDAYDSSTLLQDANTYASRHGDSQFTRDQFSNRSVPEDVSTQADCGGNGWYGEQTLDVEAVHGMAPNANVSYYGAASCFDDDLLGALASVVSDNKASIVTNSWGEPTFVVIDGQLFITIDQGLVDAYNAVFEQGAVQGIGFYFSSGDNGDDLAAWGVKGTDWPEEDPWVTSVGGTSLAVGQQGNRLFETGWGTEKYSLANNLWTLAIPFQYGAGGGCSIFDQPCYQTGVVTDCGTRAVPDISADADPTTGMLIGETQSYADATVFGPAGVHYGEFRIGGTSLASPLMAGMQAVKQSLGGPLRRIGFANPLIYQLARTSPGVYYDVKPEGDAGNVRSDYKNGLNANSGFLFSVRTFDQDSSLFTAPGWDDVSGVGSPTGAYLAGRGGGR